MTQANGNGLTAEEAQRQVERLRQDRVPSDSASRIAESLPKTSRSDGAVDWEARERRHRERAAEDARRMAEQRRRELWADARVPKRHADAAELRSSAEGPWLDTYHDFADRIDAGFLLALLGKRGTGKTQLAVCLIAAACEQGLSARYIKALDLFAELRAGMHAGNEIGAMRPYRRCDLLVIDEAHERGYTDYEGRMLTNLVDHRYDALHSTILVANQDRKGFSDAIGTSIVSRIHECGEAVVCDWPSFRSDSRG